MSNSPGSPGLDDVLAYKEKTVEEIAADEKLAQARAFAAKTALVSAENARLTEQAATVRVPAEFVLAAAIERHTAAVERLAAAHERLAEQAERATDLYMRQIESAATR